MIHMQQLDSPLPFEKEEAADGIIVVVEDDEACGEMLHEVIETQTPYQAVIIHTAEVALQHLEELGELRPALFLLDCHLLSMTGIELYDRLHAHQKLARVPALLLTGARPNEPFMQALAVRHLEVLEKPFDLDALLDCIEQLIERGTHLL